MPAGSLRPADRLAIAVTFAMLLVSCTLLPLTQDYAYLGLGWCLIVVLGGASLAIRRAGMPGAVVGVAQLILIGLLIVVIAAASGASGERLPGQVQALYGDAAHVIRTNTAPMPASAGTTLLFVSCLGGIMVICDQLVISLRKPALSFAPLLAVFGVPAIELDGGVGVWGFGCVVIAYLGILLADGLNSVRGWVTNLTHNSARRASATDGETTGTMVWRGATYLAVPAMVLALVGAAAVPTFPLPGNWGPGNGGGGHHGSIKLTDPNLDLRRNLTRPENQQVLTYRSNRSSGSYLRMASLPKLDNKGWHNGKTQVNHGTKLPEPPGRTKVRGHKRKTEIRIGDFDSQYLPLPFAPRRFSASGKWGFDPQSLVVVSAKGHDAAARATHDLRYTVRSRHIDPTAKQLRKAGAGEPPDAKETAKVPAGLPKKIKKLTKRVTRHASSKADKAAAIQDYLRNSGNFTYDLRQRPGSGFTAVDNFLFKDQAGYCEQFAGTMALMARVVGIPTRVAVGFLPGTKEGNEWVVTSNDMHSWPELYFAGYGWVRYEPTPAVQTGTPPDWTVVGHGNNAAPHTRAATPDIPTRSASAQPSTPGHQRTEAAKAPKSNTPTAGPPVGRIAGVGAGIVVLAGLLAAPGLLRIRRRRRRLYGGFSAPAARVEAGWSEIRDTATDLGDRWPNGSPRAIAGVLAGWLPGRTADIQRLSMMVERVRYARRFDDTAAAADVARLVAHIRNALLTTRTARARLRARVLPRSMFHRRR
jgi:transglutaminase-like putative cysteine protease